MRKRKGKTCLHSHAGDSIRIAKEDMQFRCTEFLLKPKYTSQIFILSLFLALLSLNACASRRSANQTATPTIPLPVVLDTVAITSVPAPKPVVFDGENAYNSYLMSQMNFGARPPGSRALKATGDYILAQLRTNGWQTETQEFNYRGIPVRNIIAKTGIGKGPVVIVGAHYDTRPRATSDKNDTSKPVLGADDGASGVAVLLELSRTLDVTHLQNEVWLAFFDAEDNGDLTACDLQPDMAGQTPTACDITPWPWSVGAKWVANSLTTAPSEVIILDMIGDADQNIYYEHNSDQSLQEELWGVAAQLGYSKQFIPEYKWAMEDDHTPFVQRGYRAIDVIDFDYPYWHTVNDTSDKVSSESLDRVGRVMQVWLESGKK